MLTLNRGQPHTAAKRCCSPRGSQEQPWGWELVGKQEDRAQGGWGVELWGKETETDRDRETDKTRGPGQVSLLIPLLTDASPPRFP